MINWTQTGRNPSLDGDWAGMGSKTNFKSRFEIVSPNGNLIPFTSKSDGIPDWDSIPPNSKLKWTVDTNGKSDRAELKLTYFDNSKYLTTYNQVLNTLSESQIQMLEAGNAQFIEEVNQTTIEKAGGLENLFVNIWSDVITTNENGQAEGIIQITETFPRNTVYLFNAHYGYDAEQERNNTSKTIEFVWDVASLPLMVVPGVNVYFVAEMVFIGAKLAASGFGFAGKNKYGKYFPQGGFNHVYSFYIEDPEQTQQDYVTSIFSDENLDIIQKMNLLTQFYGVAKIGGGLALMFVVIGLIKGRR